MKRSLARISIAAIAALFGAGIPSPPKTADPDEEPPPSVRQLTTGDRDRTVAAQAKRDRKAARRLRERT